MMIKEQVVEAIEILKKERPIFHSEDDFKFSFSKSLLDELGEDYKIRLERPEEIIMRKRDGKTVVVRAAIDIVVMNSKTGSFYPIELKYKTKKCKIDIDGEIYNLTEHGAADIGRFSFRKDIFRIEQLVKKNDNAVQGFFIVITNDEKYRNDISNKSTLDKNFSFHENAMLNKEDESWNNEKQLVDGYSLNDSFELVKNNKLHWSSKGDYFYKLDLENTYRVQWKEYSILDTTELYSSIVEIR